MSKRFTLAEAERLIPDIEKLLRQAIAAKEEYAEAESAIQEFNERIMMMGGIKVDRQVAVDARDRRESAACRQPNPFGDPQPSREHPGTSRRGLPG